jgi:NAD(P)-dependent dehydrogenase (short-subunit alcohol dehydrogenase family)
MDEIKAHYETNLFGLIRTTQAVLPVMRRQKSGTIINISSGAGRFGFPGSSAYVFTKFAVEGLSESMSYELEPFTQIWPVDLISVYGCGHMGHMSQIEEHVWYLVSSLYPLFHFKTTGF